MITVAKRSRAMPQDFADCFDSRRTNAGGAVVRRSGPPNVVTFRSPRRDLYIGGRQHSNAANLSQSTHARGASVLGPQF